MKNKKVDMLNGSVAKGLIALAIPIMIMNVAQTWVNVIDMAALRYLANDRAVGAVGACGSLITLCTSLLIGVSSGANVVVAKRVGQGDKEQVSNAAMTAILFSIIGGIVLMLVGVVFAETFLKMTNCPEGLLPQAVSYFKIYFWGVPIILFYSFCAAILRAIGDTKRPMYFLIVGGIIKIILTVLFIVLFDVTVQGVALATIVSKLVESILAIRTILKSKDSLHFDFKRIRFYTKELKEMLFIGIPTGLQSAMYSFANVTIVATVNTFGVNATTGVSIAGQFDGIIYQIIHAPSLAVMPYVAQNIGAGNIKRVKQTVIRAVLIAALFGVTFGTISVAFSAQLSSLMSTTPEVIKYSQQRMLVVSGTYFICGINEVLGGVLKGMGKPILPTIATLVFMCLIRFPWVYFVFPLCPNLTFLYLIWPIGWVLSIITLLIAYFPTISKLEKTNSESLVSENIK